MEQNKEIAKVILTGIALHALAGNAKMDVNWANNRDIVVDAAVKMGSDAADLLYQDEPADE